MMVLRFNNFAEEQIDSQFFNDNYMKNLNN